MSSICFITTGDIKKIATAKRALGMANPLVELGWEVYIVMEDTEENRHRVSLECGDKVRIYFFHHGSVLQEIKEKNRIIDALNPDYIYVCAFVTRNAVGLGRKCIKIVEHSELQSGIPDVKGFKKLYAYLSEYFSIFYSDALVNASKYLQKTFKSRCNRLFRTAKPNFYHPYAYSESIIKVVEIDRNSDENSKYKNRKIFAFLGSITRNYGAFTVIQAVEKLKREYPEVLLVMYGKGRHYNEACEYVKSKKLENWILLPGYIEEENISKFFSLADYFVSPMNDTIQDWARCPSKLYMYLPYKKPIVTCKIGEPYEVLKDEGCYYVPSDSQNLCDTMRGLIESDKKEININPKLHSWKTRAKEFDIWIKQTFKK